MTRTITTIYDQLSQRDPYPPLNLDQEVYYPPLTDEINRLDASQHVKAALHMLNDDIQRAHYFAEMNQGDPLLDYLHALVHRREGDFWNSKWWFARVQHPLIKKIYTGKLYPEKVVDKIEELEVTNDPEARKILENLQYNELCSIAMTAIENKLYD
ncbi:hypothetical protein E3Q22_02808 [Wallemia mellicola]|uniref:Uncharacterized protein n=2 Tax=Wallemia mellicola TaxID=1708541 RepID=A0A4T0N6X7_9BASI|nr:hypothetical protein WALSEDRAFT_59013 [Wallemia mellicola CBS 633.66]TIB66826.1 hypothetical protein E3Q24_04333 [Wallemia mellicola]EIM23926.1 hypothetical protein WALSEDRAFT_59013 [Wallemia mellicola CBS 633.66]TIB72604.1 hypothetical protein E3Q23_03305 [Wallemia mellicola]TIB78068.1 hypothetical protein E3Q22_02808 [Wallemia mellicola]TIB92349.1 hypothetical protein E3Q19_01945 [Wallemia mellicola]|eukprot:XP_006955766.1 hypothetical protein WALSEDRAFT_59013 [Wallemia mellicola CBS 633.66]